MSEGSASTNVTAAPPAGAVKQFHRTPRQSASSALMNSRCAGAFARAAEMHRFTEDHGLEPLETAMFARAAEEGTQAHRLLALMPFYSPRFGVGSTEHARVRLQGAELVAALERTIDEHRLDVGEDLKWFCFRAIEARDTLIDYVLTEAPGAQAPWRSVRVTLDHDRLQTTFGPDEVEYSGQPDVLVEAVDSRGQLFGAVLDFKSGFGEGMMPSARAQVSDLAVLESRTARARGANVAGVFTAVLNKADLAAARIPNGGTQSERPLQVSYFSPDALSKAEGLVEARVVRNDNLRRAALAQMDLDGKLPAAIEAEISAKSQAGSHCMFCAGKVACSNIRSFLASHFEGREQQLGTYEAANETLKALTAKGKNALKPEGIIPLAEQAAADLNMTLNQLPQVMVAATDLAAKTKLATELKTQLDGLARALASRNVALPGVTLKPGAKVLEVRPDANAQGRELSTLEIYRRLTPLLPKNAEGKPVLTMGQWVSSTTQTQVAAVKAVLRVVFPDLPKSKDQPLLDLLAQLGAQNPFEQRRRASSIEIDYEMAMSAGQVPTEESAEEEEAAVATA